MTSQLMNKLRRNPIVSFAFQTHLTEWGEFHYFFCFLNSGIKQGGFTLMSNAKCNQEIFSLDSYYFVDISTSLLPKQ